MFEAGGESLDIPGIGLCRGVGVLAREGDSTSVVNLCEEVFWEETVGFGVGGSSYVGQGGGYGLCKGIGAGLDPAAKKRLSTPILSLFFLFFFFFFFCISCALFYLLSRYKDYVQR